MVVDEGVLFRTTDSAYVQTKRKLLDTCNLWCIVSLPVGAFVNAGASIKTDLLFFTKGQPTQTVWYYDLSDLKMSKKTPLALEHFDEFFRLLPQLADSERSWSVTRAQIEDKDFDLKAVNPHYRVQQDTRNLDELLREVEEKNREIRENLRALRLYSMDNDL
jgi:type I restriction enzyme M protein